MIRYVYALSNSTEKFVDLTSLILAGINSNRIYKSNIDEILESLAIVKPYDFLELLFEAYQEEDFTFRNYYDDNPLFHIEEELLINWIESVEFKNRYNRVRMLLYNVKLYKNTENKYSWSKLGRYIINDFYENEDILRHIELNIFSLNSLGVISRSMASIFDERRSLITELFMGEKQELCRWAERVNTEQIKNIEQMRKEELKRDRRMEYFEY